MTKQLTLQEIFDICVGGLIKQRVPAVNENGCDYRRGDLRCVVGQLFDDTIDTEPFSYFWVCRDDPARGRDDAPLNQALTSVGIPFTEKAYTLLELMQFVHDDTHHEVMKGMLRDCVIGDINTPIDDLRGNKTYENRCVKFWKEKYTIVANTFSLNTDCFNI